MVRFGFNPLITAVMIGALRVKHCHAEHDHPKFIDSINLAFS